MEEVAHRLAPLVARTVAGSAPGVSLGHGATRDGSERWAHLETEGHRQIAAIGDLGTKSAVLVRARVERRTWKEDLGPERDGSCGARRGRPSPDHPQRSRMPTRLACLSAPCEFHRIHEWFHLPVGSPRTQQTHTAHPSLRSQMRLILQGLGARQPRAIRGRCCLSQRM